MRRLGMTITILYPFLIFTALGVAPTRLGAWLGRFLPRPSGS